MTLVPSAPHLDVFVRSADAGDGEPPAKKIKIEPTDLFKEADVTSLKNPLLGNQQKLSNILIAKLYFVLRVSINV